MSDDSLFEDPDLLAEPALDDGGFADLDGDFAEPELEADAGESEGKKKKKKKKKKSKEAKAKKDKPGTVKKGFTGYDGLLLMSLILVATATVMLVLEYLSYGE